MKHSHLHLVFALTLTLFTVPQSRGWDYEGHRLINQLALDTLPQNFPSFERVSASAFSPVSPTAGAILPTSN
jgi:hypothetical protein